MEISELQQQVDNWIQTYGVRYFNETTNMILLTEEVGELAKLIARVYGEQSFKKTEDKHNAQDHIADEIGDILFVLTCLANQMNINLTTVIQSNLIKKTNRDKERHKDNQKLND